MLEFVLFRVDTEEYAIPIGEVKEIISYQGANRLPDMPCYMEGVINLRDSLIPVISLRTMFGLESRAERQNSRAVIIQAQGRPSSMAVIVDEVTEVARVKEEAIEPVPAFAQNRFLSGIGILQNRLVLLLNTGSLMDVQPQIV